MTHHGDPVGAGKTPLLVEGEGEGEGERGGGRKEGGEIQRPSQSNLILNTPRMENLIPVPEKRQMVAGGTHGDGTQLISELPKPIDLCTCVHACSFYVNYATIIIVLY